MMTEAEATALRQETYELRRRVGTLEVIIETMEQRDCSGRAAEALPLAQTIDDVDALYAAIKGRLMADVAELLFRTMRGPVGTQ
jgi:hypothetical protein